MLILLVASSTLTDKQHKLPDCGTPNQRLISDRVQQSAQNEHNANSITDDVRSQPINDEGILLESSVALPGLID